MSRRKIRPLILGKDGAGKSYFAASFPKPMLVCLFDAPDKAEAYLRRGDAHELEKGKYCFFQDVFSKDDPTKRIIRIEYWGESNPDNPTSYGRFIARSANLESEIVAENWQTVVLDSTTAFELAARFYSENNINKTNPDGRRHYGFSAHACEQYVMTRWPNLINTNAVVIGHYADHKEDSEDGERTIITKTVALPGQMPDKIGTQFAEVWRVYIDPNGNRFVQTGKRATSSFACKTSMGFADNVYPHYDALWKSIELEEVAKSEKSE